MFNLKLLSFIFNPVSFVQSLQALVRSLKILCLSLKPLHTFKGCNRVFESLVFSRLKNLTSLSLSLWMKVSRFLTMLVSASGPTLTGPCFSFSVGPRYKCSTPCVVSQVQRRRISSLTLLVQPRVWLAFWSVNVHCQVIPNLSFTNTPKSFPAGLLSSD